jgi:DNA adenine methylase
MKSSHNVLTPVPPAEPAAPWLGGKRHLARRICALIAATDHAAYVEPFVGMGGVFLRRAQRPSSEVINDINGEVANLFRILQRHPEALFRELLWRPAMRAEFDRLKGARVQDLTDVERAARFLYLQRLAFAGKVKGQSFGVDTVNGHNFDIRRLEPRLRRLHDRLAGVIIENLDWEDCLRVYDRDGTLFYLDPPYWGGEDDYGPGIFAPLSFEALAAALREIRGRFLLSINDVPDIRAMFAWADIQEVRTRYSVGGASEVPELLIGRGVNLAGAAPQASLF